MIIKKTIDFECRANQWMSGFSFGSVMSAQWLEFVGAVEQIFRPSGPRLSRLPRSPGLAAGATSYGPSGPRPRSFLVFVFFFLWRLDLHLRLLQNIRIQLCKFVSADGYNTFAALEPFGDLHIRTVADSQRHGLLLRLV